MCTPKELWINTFGSTFYLLLDFLVQHSRCTVCVKTHFSPHRGKHRALSRAEEKVFSFFNHNKACFTFSFLTFSTLTVTSGALKQVLLLHQVSSLGIKASAEPDLRVHSLWMGEAKPGVFCSSASGQHSLSLAAEGSLAVASIWVCCLYSFSLCCDILIPIPQFRQASD